jgi:glycosyltransferase involved in cell wall biosynthesis
MMKVGLVHDWLTGMRGGEKVLLALARMFPDAPIHTLLHVRGSLDPELERRDIRTTFVQRLPGAARHYRSYLPLFPAATATIDVTPYDLVISSSHCVAKGVKRRVGALHICYCHTPMRYVWDRYDDYFGGDRVAPPARPLIALAAHRLRAWDVATAPRVDRFAANSAYVAARIRRYYGRPSTVIPPPVDTDFFTPGPEGPGAYDLVVSALVPYKRLGLVLDAYRGSKVPLKIVGTGPEADRLRESAGPETAFLGRVDDAALRDLYRGARAVIMPNVEDFGITAVEAMACGRPVVVFGEGGGTESVIHGETGVVFHEPTPLALRAAVDSLPALRFNTAALRARAESFSRARFESRFRAFLDAALDQNAAAGAAQPGPPLAMKTTSAW